MSDSLRPLSRSRLYEQLMERLLDHIRESDLRPGDRLPSERELAERLRVSRNSLKQATVALEVQGIVETRQGGGTYFRGVPREPESVSALLDRRNRLPEILEAREAIEIKVAELAAIRRTDSDLDQMRQALQEMAAAIEAGDLGAEADRRFHLAVVNAGRNSLLAAFYFDISQGISESRLESLRQPGRPRRSLAQHRLIYEAIVAQDPKRAVSAVRRHLHTVAEVRLLKWRLDSANGEVE